jgi:hypothetical protein
MKNSSFTIDEMLKAIKEIGQTPGMEKHQPILKDMAWILKDHVELVAKLKKHVPRLSNQKIASAESRLSGFSDEKA